MIRFKTVRYKNILSVGNYFIEVDLTKSQKTLITAENGSGKSTMIDAIIFALYGKPYRKINKPNLVNSINQKGLLVEFEFSIGDKEYLIRRGIKPNVFEIFQDGFLINQDSTNRDYQEYLEVEILKMNYKTCTQLVIIGSANHTPFMQLVPQQRREIIENILDLEIFSTMNTILKERIQVNKSELQQIKYDIDLANEKVSLHEEYLKSLQQNNQELIDDNLKKIEKTNNEINDLIIDIQNLTNSATLLVETIKDQDKVEKKISDLIFLEKQIEDRVRTNKKEIKFFEENDICPTCKQGIEDNHKHDYVESKKTSMAESKDSLKVIEGRLEKLNIRLTEIKTIQSKIDELNKSINSNNYKKESLRHFITKVQEEIDKITDKNRVSEEDTKKAEELKNDVVRLEKYREELVKDRAVLDTASVLLKDGGIKGKIIKQYVPIINKLVNKYLSIFELFVQFELDENFSETLKSRHRDEFTYESFSEGEKKRIDLSLLATWRAIAKLRSNNDINLLILDEIMDSSLDLNGIDNMFSMLETNKEHTNLFVISHRENIADKFNSHIKFEKVKNFTYKVE